MLVISSWNEVESELTLQILYQSDTSIEVAAQSALESLMRAVYPGEKDSPAGLAQDIIKECLGFLEDPEKSTALAATKGLVAMFNSNGKQPESRQSATAKGIRHCWTLHHLAGTTVPLPAVQPPCFSLPSYPYPVVRHLAPHRGVKSLLRGRVHQAVQPGTQL